MSVVLSVMYMNMYVSVVYVVCVRYVCRAATLMLVHCNVYLYCNYS